MGFCTRCGAEYAGGTSFCQACGANLTGPPAGGTPATAAEARVPAGGVGRAPRRRSPSRLLIPLAAFGVGVIATLLVTYALASNAGLAAVAERLEGTWVEQGSGSRIIIDCEGGAATATLIRGEDGAVVGGVKLEGDLLEMGDGEDFRYSPNLSVSIGDGHATLDVDGESMTWVRQ